VLGTVRSSARALGVGETSIATTFSSDRERADRETSPLRSTALATL
jgi:hypothetical protein